MKNPGQRLFTPGDGATPPALTGREREEAVLKRCIGDLLGGRAPPHNVVLTGPRGTGKTVLLNWFERACRDYVSDVDVVKLTPDDIPTREALIEVLAPPAGIAKLLPRKLGVAAVGSVEWAPPAGGMRNLREELTARCRRKPLATLVDEAHTLDLEVGRALLNASQQVRADAPFLLVLAGTPGLAAHLGAMNASFWSRLGEGRLGIGLLSDVAARAARRDRQDHRLLRGSIPGVESIRLVGRCRARGRPFSIHADADLRGVEVRGRRRSRCERGPAAGAYGPDRPAAPGLRLAPARPASAGSLRARNSLADGLRTRPRRTDAWRSTSRDQIALLVSAAAPAVRRRARASGPWQWRNDHGTATPRPDRQPRR